MWIFSVQGFVSVVADWKDPSRVFVRGRSRKDVEAFGRRLGVSVIDTPSADYPFRVVVCKKKFAKLLAEMAEAIDYPNFKDEVLGTQGPARESLYHQVWSVMRRGLEKERPQGT
jgi:hypothetical protein